MKQSGGLSVIQLTMLALGTVIGGSFFLGSAIAIRAAGPAIFISYIIGGLLVYLILTSLSEMTVANPQSGSFRLYAEKAFGPWVGFLIGWVYWTGLVLAMSSEATAASIFIRGWFPQISLPLLSISIVVAITLLNLLGARTLSNLESGLAAIKIAALILFVILALVLVGGFLPDKPPIGMGVLNTAELLPNGLGGIAGSMLIVLFSYAGFEIIGLAAPEARNPHRNVPRAILLTTISLVGLYTAVITLLLTLIPTASLTGEASPMVAALNAGGFGVAAGYVNVILVTAILSTMLAATFGLGRMMRSLAEAGHAPYFLVDRQEVPIRGIIFSGIAMLLGVSLSFVLPNQIYIFLVSSGGFALLFTYVVILLTHYKFRSTQGCPPKGNCQLIGYPYTSWLAIISLIIIIITMPLIPGQGSGLMAGLLLLIIYSASYWISKYYSKFKQLVAAKPYWRHGKNQDKPKS